MTDTTQWRSPSSGPIRSKKLNCEECRRLKLKCNRNGPAQNASDGGRFIFVLTEPPLLPFSKNAQIQQLQARVHHLENQLERQLLPPGTAGSFTSSGEAVVPVSFSPTQTASVVPNPQKNSISSQSWPGVTESVGQLTWKRGGNSRFYGITAAEHRIASPDGSEDDREFEAATYGETSSFDQVDVLQAADWPFKNVDAPTKATMLAKLLACLPSEGEARALSNDYWELTSWRFEPFTRTFYEDVIREVYPNQADAPPPHPHKLALVFAVLGLSSLLDSELASTANAAARYYACTKSCLTVGSFLKDISVASLAAMHLICGYMLNADGRSEELYVLVGLALRMGMAAGFHRDGSWWNLEQPHLDYRRRIWWEICQLERVHSFGFGLPLSIPVGCDTARPSNLSPISFLWWKWDLQVIVSDVLHSILMTPYTSYEAIQSADQKLRSYDNKIPEHLRCTSTALWKPDPTVAETQFRTSTSDYVLIPGMDEEGIPLVLKLQQIRLAILFNIALLYLHRSSFIASLQGSPLQGSLAPSYLTVVLEASSNLINLVSILHKIKPACSRWASNAMDLFGAIACQAATLIQTPTSPLAEHCKRNLEIGLDVMESIYAEMPLVRVKVLLHKTRKLRSQAEDSLAQVNFASSENDVFQQSESKTSLLRDTSSTTDQVGTLNPAVDLQPTAPTFQGMSNVDFDAWIVAIMGGDQGS